MRFLLANGLFWVSVVCCAVAQILIIRSIRGARHLPEPAAGVPRAHAAVELFWAVVPAIALAALLFFTFREIRSKNTSVHSTTAQSIAHS